MAYSKGQLAGGTLCRQICWHSCLLTYRPSFRFMQYGAQYQDLDEHFRQTTVELTTHQIVPSLERFFTQALCFFISLSSIIFSYQAPQDAGFATLLQCLIVIISSNISPVLKTSLFVLFTLSSSRSSLKFHKKHSSVTVSLLRTRYHCLVISTPYSFLQKVPFPFIE